MKMKNAIILIFSIFSFWGNAQLILPEYQVSKVKSSEAMLRWEPRSIQEMDDAFDIGYTVDVYILDGVEKKLLTSDKVKIASKNDWRKAMNAPSEYSDFREASAMLLYPELREEIDEMPNGFMDGKDNIKLGLIQYYGVYDFEITKMAGYGYSFPITKDAKYQVVVSCGSHESFDFYIDSNNTEEILPDFHGIWGDKEVSLQCNTKQFRTKWFGYDIKKSEDEFGIYTEINNATLVNNYDSSEVVELQILETKDSLAFNDKLYFYQLYGVDFFGGKSKSFKSISGSGYDRITMSPIIKMADQMENNDAYISWEIREKYIPLIDHFRIMGAETRNGDYLNFSDSISSNATEIRVPMRYPKNYFRVEAVPHRGKVVSSTPVFVMGMDTIPPAAPVIVEASIDSTGRTRVVWNTNSEPDFEGYRVFWSNRYNHEFSVLDASPSPDTIFVDSLNLNFSEEHIFYKVVAYDKRNNASKPSEIVKLERPDIIPPGMPKIKNIETHLDTVWISCSPSGSTDAVIHQLFRKDLNDNFGNWLLVKVFEEPYENKEFLYIDTGLPIGGKYAYTMIAFDDANLKSKPSKARSVLIKEDKEVLEPIISFDASTTEQKVLLNWELNDKLNYSNILLYRGTQKHKITKYKYLDASAVSFVDEVSDGQSYYYFIKPFYEGQLSDCKSEIILTEFKGE